MMVSDFVRRNKIILVVSILIVILGLSVKFKMPLSDTQKLTGFNNNLMTLNAPVDMGVKKFKASYDMTIKTYTMRTVYMDALDLNLAAQKALRRTQIQLQVPGFRNKDAQAAVQNAHDLYVAYIKSLEVVSKNVITLAQNSGYAAKLSPLTLPSMDKVTENINAAYTALGNKPVTKT